eukprot:251586-Hanusia_phi.AAC.1
MATASDERAREKSTRQARECEVERLSERTEQCLERIHARTHSSARFHEQDAPCCPALAPFLSLSSSPPYPLSDSARPVPSCRLLITRCSGNSRGCQARSSSNGPGRSATTSEADSDARPDAFPVLYSSLLAR